MNTRQLDSWAERNGWKVISLVAAGAVAWATLKAQVAGKVDESAFSRHIKQSDSIHVNLINAQNQLMTTINHAETELAHTHRYLCRKSPSDIGC